MLWPKFSPMFSLMFLPGLGMVSEPYAALWSLTEQPYGALRCPTEAYGALRSLTEP